MKKKIFLTITAMVLILVAFGQKPSIEITYTAIDSAAYVQLDSIKIMNRTQGGDTVLYYPDTVIVLDYQVGIPDTDFVNEGFQVFQNYPNPVAGQTTVSMYVPEKDRVSIMVTDILGRVIVKSERVLDKGKHTFRFIPGNVNLYFFTATCQGQRSSIKILQTNPISFNSAVLEYIGNKNSSPQLKAIKDIQSFLFNLGDTLLYIGYFDTLQSGMLNKPQESGDYTFQFATNIPCPGTPTVEYEGQVYNTIQIFSQCWLKENLNVGVMIDSLEEMQNNGIIEKYCYHNEPDSCTKFGGLYQWNEMMQYTTQQGVQGICPPGWNLPSNEDWGVLIGAVDSQYGIGDLYNCIDAGLNLKTTSGWYGNGNGSNLFGFSGLPGGSRITQGNFIFVTKYGRFWSSTEEYDNSGNAPFLYLYYEWMHTVLGSYPKNYGYSVRCLLD